MKLKKFSIPSFDLLITLAISFLAVIFSLSNEYQLLRIIFGFLMIFFSAGYPVFVLFFPKEKYSLNENIIGSSLISILLLFPAGVFTVAMEGIDANAIFSRHLTHSLTSLIILQIIFTYLVLIRRRKRTSLRKSTENTKISPILLISIAIYLFLTINNLNRADVRGDEYDLGYQAYNLVNGIFAARKAYTISFDGHPPLTMHVKHFTMQVLNPSGLDQIKDWEFRVSEIIFGILTIIISYSFSEKFLNRKIAGLTSIILSVNNYLVFMGRFFERSIYIAPFAIASIYWLFKYKNSKESKHLTFSGILLGGAFLVKASAIATLIPIAFFLYLWKRNKLLVLKFLLIVTLMYTPVLIFNLGSYLTTGYLDTNFSRLIGKTHPHATPLPENRLVTNPAAIISLLTDQYSLPLMVLFLSSIIWSIYKKRNSSVHQFMIFWIISILTFFTLTVVRAYYMVFITIPFSILAANMISSIKKKNVIISIIFFFVLFYSAIYSYKTNIDSSYVISKEYDDAGRTGTPFLIPSLNRHFSISARAWTENRGWKNLIVALDQKLKPEDCLIVKNNLDNLAVRRYLWTNDLVKEHFFAQTYPTRYNRCPLYNQGFVGSLYFLSDKTNEAGRIVETITDDLGNPRFYLFQLEKGNYS